MASESELENASIYHVMSIALHIDERTPNTVATPTPHNHITAMSTTRNHHYVPQWYQKGFWEAEKRTLAYLNLSPKVFRQANGQDKVARSLHEAPPARAFVERDLYSTFFRASVNDEIERKLFGDIDTRGAAAVRAYAGGDLADIHHHFQDFYEYIDIQKLRTPKGLDWLKAQHPELSQNELMMEMQAIRMLHCTLWTEGVREIVSAEDSDVKFIISDHPVTVFNAAASPGSPLAKYPNEPGIELKGTQTIFPLDRNHCLILTNLEYAENPDCDLLSKRTFARRFRTSMVNTHALIQDRKLSSDEVWDINRVIRTRARKFVAAGRSEWLPEPISSKREWNKVAKPLLPPSEKLFGFGGEMFMSYDNGDVHYQDAFGRTEKQHEVFNKSIDESVLKSRDLCGCGSGRDYAKCCKNKPIELRPSWDQMSIRERNMALFNAIMEILAIKRDDDWTEIRKRITDEKISEIYSVYGHGWPLETDLLSLLPKPDGVPRAVYTGLIHPEKISQTALGASLMFEEVLIQHPFSNPRTLKDDFNPVKNPSAYRQEILKSILFFMQIMPLVEVGMVNLIPDPWDFDYHLREQSMRIAEERLSFLHPILKPDGEFKELAEDEYKRTIYNMSEASQRRFVQSNLPELSTKEQERLIAGLRALRDQDQLAVLQDDGRLEDVKGGYLSSFKLSPNFEMAMYIAQATGAAIVTDHPIRWNEILFSILLRESDPTHHLKSIAASLEQGTFSFLQYFPELIQWWSEERPQPMKSAFKDLYRYLSRAKMRDDKPNVEQRLRAKVKRARLDYEKEVMALGPIRDQVTVECAFPKGGIYDSSITRLLLMSSSDHHVKSVPMAFYLKSTSQMRPATPLESQKPTFFNVLNRKI